MSNPLHVSSDTFQKDVLESDVPVVVDFWAPWCGPCRAIAPMLEAFAVQYAGKVKVAKVNVDDEPELAQAFEIRGIPTLAAFRDGELVDVQVGLGRPAALERWFADLAVRVPA